MKLLRQGNGITESRAVEIDTMSGEEVRACVTEYSEQTNDAWNQGGRTAFGMTTFAQVQICERILNGKTRPFEEDSPEDFARRYLHLHRLAQNHIASGNCDLAALTAWEAGTVFAQAEMKWRWERHALAGEQTARRLNEITRQKNRERKMSADAKHALWRDEADKVALENPGLSKIREAQRVIARLGLAEKPDTVAKGIKKVRMAL